MRDRSRKFFFMHIPKTGGSSIEKALCLPEEAWSDPVVGSEWLQGNLTADIAIQHLTPVQLAWRGLMTFDELQSYRSFAFVRNPWDRFVSEFHHRNKPDFGEFLSFCASEIREGRAYSHMWQHIVPQYDFIFAPDGTQMIEKIYRFENLRDEF